MMKLNKVESCCFCISVRVGAYILGFMEVLNLIGQITHFNPLGILITGPIAFAFLLMWNDDTEEKRMWYFFTYMAGTLLLLLAAALIITGVIGNGT